MGDDLLSLLQPSATQPSLHHRLQHGEWVEVGGKIYAMCGVCGDVIRVNKPIVGSMHFCLTDEEIKLQRERRGLSR